jgi:hypothetical protein
MLSIWLSTCNSEYYLVKLSMTFQIEVLKMGIYFGGFTVSEFCCIAT